MGRVGRFQVMATLQAARALALGLSPDEAASFGLNRAVFYAVAKGGFRQRTAPRAGAGARPPAKKPGPRRGRRGEELVTVGGEEAYATRDRRGELRFAFGDETQQPEDFDREIGRRFDHWPAAWAEAQAIIAEAGEDALASRSRFFEEVYKPRRDALARRWSALGPPAASSRG